MVDKTLVQSQSIGDRTQLCQRNVVTRQINPLEAVSFFEIHQAVPFLFSVVEPRIDEVGDLLLGAVLDCPGHQGVIWSFVSVFDQRQKMRQSSLGSSTIAMKL